MLHLIVPVLNEAFVIIDVDDCQMLAADTVWPVDIPSVTAMRPNPSPVTTTHDDPVRGTLLGTPYRSSGFPTENVSESVPPILTTVNKTLSKGMATSFTRTTVSETQ